MTDDEEPRIPEDAARAVRAHERFMRAAMAIGTDEGLDTSEMLYAITLVVGKILLGLEGSQGWPYAAGSAHVLKILDAVWLSARQAAQPKLRLIAGNPPEELHHPPEAPADLPPDTE